MEQLKEQSAHEGHCEATQKLTPPHISGNGGGARFENPTGSETIKPDSSSSFRSQSLTDESEVGEEPIKTDWTG